LYGSHGLEKSHWNIDDIRYGDVDIERVREREELFILVCSASFIESCSDIYTHNLVTNFFDDPEIAVWLSEQWQPEELQHGRALKAYVEHVWPEFDWNLAFADLLSEYSKLCSMEKLEPTRAQERFRDALLRWAPPLITRHFMPFAMNRFFKILLGASAMTS
jgi:hypothetical protein